MIGPGTTLLRWLTGISLGIGLLVVLNQLQIPYYLYYPRTTTTVLISSAIDFYLFLVSSLCVPLAFAQSPRKFSIPTSVGLVAVWLVALMLTILNQPLVVVILYAVVICTAVLSVMRVEDRRGAISEILPSALVVLALVEASCVFYWAGAALNPNARVGFLSEQNEANLTFSLYPIAIPILLLLMFSWLWIPLLTRLPNLRKRFMVRYEPSMSKLSKRSLAASLDLFAIIAMLVFFYSYLAGQTWIVGVDSHWRYLDPLNQLGGFGISQAVNTSVTHGLYVAFLYLVESGTGISASAIVKFAPLILAFCTASAVFFATLRGGWNLELARLTAICTLLWFPTTLGIWAGIQANWVALFVWMIFLSFYLPNRDRSLLTYVGMGLLSLIMFIAHPWTWGVFATTLALATLISWRAPWRKRCLQALIAALVVALPVGLTAYLISPSVNLDFDSTLQLYSLTLLNPVTLLESGGALLELFTNWSSFLSPAILLLSLVGAYTLSKRRGVIANYLMAWAATWCIGSILVAPTGYNPVNTGMSETGLWRMLYVSPLPILLALGLEWGVQLFNDSDSRSLNGGRGQRAPQFDSLLTSLPFLAIGAGLFTFWNAALRLALVAIALLLALVLTFRLHSSRTSKTLTVLVILLIVVNAAFRTLFPLLLDPHNLFT